MGEAFAALILRPDEGSDEARSLGMAMSLAGCDLARPRLDIAALEGVEGWSVALDGGAAREGSQGAEVRAPGCSL